MNVLVLDNYDSFTWNVVQLFESLGADCRVVRSDAVTVDEIDVMDARRIVISPGPYGPERTGVCGDAVQRLSPRIPTLGICLGMQVIAVAAGARVVASGEPVHGRSSPVVHEGGGVLRGLPSPFRAARYQSLVVDPDSVPDELEVTGRTPDGTVMAIRWRDRLVEGVLFHPESFLTEHGEALARNFLEGAGDVV